MRRGAVAAVLVGAAVLLSGCQYLLGPLAGGPVFVPGPGDFGSFDPNDPGFAQPSPDATFTKGSAKVTIAGETLELNQIAGTALMYKVLGTDVAWTDGRGNYLHFFGAGGLEAPGFVSIDRIADGHHLGTQDPTACTAKVEKSEATGVAGSASCKGLRWIDMLNSFGGFTPPSPGPPFDAEITFEATP